MKLRDAPLDEPHDAMIVTAWRNAPSFLRDAQMTEEIPNLLSTCWCDALSLPTRRAIGRNYLKLAQHHGATRHQPL
ncbi:hypothetical protein A2U01_0062625, partial [Trifolium medium]|nr:hypothetical protein [Trifolium medium]